MNPVEVVRAGVTRNDGGWAIGVTDDNGTANLSEMTPPFRGPNSSDLFAINFLSGNGPTREHSLIFSPEVGNTITWQAIDLLMSKNQGDAVFALLRRIEAFGSLELNVTDMKLRGTTGEDAAFDWVEFDVHVSWPAGYTPARR